MKSPNVLSLVFMGADGLSNSVSIEKSAGRHVYYCSFIKNFFSYLSFVFCNTFNRLQAATYRGIFFLDILKAVTSVETTFGSDCLEQKVECSACMTLSTRP